MVNATIKHNGIIRVALMISGPAAFFASSNAVAI